MYDGAFIVESLGIQAMNAFLPNPHLPLYAHIREVFVAGCNEAFSLPYRSNTSNFRLPEVRDETEDASFPS